MTTPHCHGTPLILSSSEPRRRKKWDKWRMAHRIKWPGHSRWEDRDFNSRGLLFLATDSEHHSWFFQLLLTLKEYSAEFWNICFDCLHFNYSNRTVCSKYHGAVTKTTNCLVHISCLPPNSSDTQIKEVLTDSEQQWANRSSSKWVLQSPKPEKLAHSSRIQQLSLDSFLTPRNETCPTSKAFSQLFTPSFLKRLVHFASQIPHSPAIPQSSYLASHSFSVSLADSSSCLQPFNTCRVRSLSSGSSLPTLTRYATWFHLVLGLQIPLQV